MEDISQSVLTIVSYLETLVITGDMQTKANKAKRVFNKLGLTEEDKEALAKVLKAIIIMTNGSVKTIRNPERFESKYATSFRRIASPQMSMIFDVMGKTSIIDRKITQQDYELTKSVVSWLGNRIVTSKDIDALNNDQDLIAAMDNKIPQAVPEKLYRGLEDLSIESFMLLLQPQATMNINEGVSTSTYKETAESFCNKGLRTMITINNPQGKGLTAGNLSYWMEEEVILSGVLEFNSWKIQPFIGYFHENIGIRPTKCSIIVSSDLIELRPTKPFVGAPPTFEMDSVEFLEKLFNMVKNSSYGEEIVDANGRTLIQISLASILHLRLDMNATVR
jgi:hypothetical protein